MQRWYERRKPVDLIEACQAEAHEFRAAELQQRADDPFMSNMLSHMEWNLKADGGWCAPSEIIYDLKPGGLIPVKDVRRMEFAR